jgi:hypothetical protein
MKIALLGLSASPLLDRVADRCGGECVQLDLRTAWRGGELTVDAGRVLWDGCDLTAMDALLVERPLFAWPQPGSGAEGLSPHAEREARALTLSALHTAAESVRTLDPPSAAELAVAPVLALERCARAGLRVRPWDLVPERPAGQERIWLDPAGSDPWLEPRHPDPGEPAFGPEPFDGPVLSLLAVGAELVAALRFDSAGDWALGRGAIGWHPGEIPPEARALALAAREALGLSWLRTDLFPRASGAELLRVVAGPDLCSFGPESETAVASALTALLLDPTPSTT